MRFGDLPAKARKQVAARITTLDTMIGTTGTARYKAAQAHLNAVASAMAGNVKVAKRKLPPALSTAEERFALQLRTQGPAMSGPAYDVIRGYEREHRFMHGRKWRFDFAWANDRIAVEVEGVTNDGGRHQRVKGYTEDCRKYNAAALIGWIVVRVTPAMVKSGEALQLLGQAFSRRFNERQLARTAA